MLFEFKKKETQLCFTFNWFRQKESYCVRRRTEGKKSKRAGRTKRKETCERSECNRQKKLFNLNYKYVKNKKRSLFRIFFLLLSWFRLYWVFSDEQSADFMHFAYCLHICYHKFFAYSCILLCFSRKLLRILYFLLSDYFCWLTCKMRNGLCWVLFLLEHY